MIEKLRIFFGGCSHDFEARGWSYVLCKKCQRSFDNPQLNREMRNKFIDKMVESGAWKESEVFIARHR
jgi:hypothetical protein